MRPESLGATVHSARHVGLTKKKYNAGCWQVASGEWRQQRQRARRSLDECALSREQTEPQYLFLLKNQHQRHKEPVKRSSHVVFVTLMTLMFVYI
jgi:hypothetical protein